MGRLWTPGLPRIWRPPLPPPERRYGPEWGDQPYDWQGLRREPLQAAWSHIQAASGAQISGATLGVAYTTANLTSGTKLIAVTACAGTAASTTAAVKDAALNAMTKLASVSGIGSTTNLEVALWAMDTPAGDVGTKPTLTATLSNSAGSSGMVIQEVAGLAVGSTLAAMIDGTPGTGTAQSSSTVAPSYNSSVANEYLVSVVGDWGDGSTWAQPAGYSGPDGVNSSGDNDVLIAWKGSTGGVESGNWTGGASASTLWGAILCAFKLAGAAPASVLQNPRRRDPWGPARAWAAIR
jgi:hypothetical protein